MTEEARYRELGLMVGLELHQQLDTTRKLYCHCPTLIRDDEPIDGFVRRLRPTQSEMGAIDPAALFEFQQQKRFYYEYYNDTTCLVEADEEPPHDLCDEAIDIGLTMANFLKSSPMDEIHSMRKIVIDGSNTTGFQRTCVVAIGGAIRVGDKEIGIQTIGLEEDAARKIADDDKRNMRIYRLDRLGIPLVEIATAPDIHTPSQAQETALAIGLLLRSTGRVKRGIGTIRQDVNVSIEGGAIIEIKGFQQLNMLDDLVKFEAQRQEQLLKIRDSLVDRGVSLEAIEGKIEDVSEILSGTDSKVLKKALKAGGSVTALLLPGFAGLVGKEIQPNRRLGTEFSDYARFWGGVGGIFHTDELPSYGITDTEVAEVKRFLGAKDEDAVIIVAAPKKNCEDALQAVLKRAHQAVVGVPAETRTPLSDATTKYARPRPGAERMYPETDVRPVKITTARLKRIMREMPETLEKKKKRFVEQYELSEDLASQITRSLNLDLFESIVNQLDVPPTLVVVTLENTLVSLHRDGIPTENLDEQHLVDLFEAISKNEVSSEAIPTILTHLSKNPSSNVKEAIEEAGLGRIETTEVEEVIKRIVSERADFVRERGEAAIGGLMGVAMKELRGKVNGKTVRNLLAVEVERVLSG
ncbi:MAG: Glu-tRNA(Gln) amidotransferase subunit GatE [Candidatus Thorarchaeota archaeon]|nr:MAG: Glu-tRNA(Gln) amidotransferase subunit GatE [Candidatus Thorarchaeota archaeon]